MNARGKTVDKTYLSIDQAEDRGFIHRDYIAHCLRWSHVCKRLYERRTYESAIILDVGCGRELPMAKMLYSSRLIPRHYFGVDAGPIEDDQAAKLMSGKFPHTLWEKTNFLELKQGEVSVPCPRCNGSGVEGDSKHDTENTTCGECGGDTILPNIVTCFEVLEHVEPDMMLRMLDWMWKLSSADARFFISTPCWNRTDCAANHVNEILYEALGAVFEREGFMVEHVYGTFASIRDYQQELTRSPEGLLSGNGVPEHVFDALREYYDSNFLSCIFAPLFPAQSRNCLWELRKAPPGGADDNHFKPLSMIQQPWSSSTRWAELERK